MKILDFNYIDSKNKASNRHVVVLADVHDKIFGIDYTELSHEDSAEFLCDLAMLVELHKHQQELLLKQYDIANKYRRFIPDRMSNIIMEEV